jgi:molybdopterin/thiamine biosynthesis adenylyltransferase
MRHVKTEHQALAASRALVVGVGGLGSPAAIALAEAGVDTIGLVDPDRVEASNLHRQPLYTDADIGALKVEAAAARLRTVRPGVRIVTWSVRFGPGWAALLDGFDVILDGTDSAAAKFALNDAAVARRLPLVHAGAIGTRAQLLTVLPGETACLRCLFEDSPGPDEAPSCQEAGVLGPSVVLAGTLQGAEAVRLLAGAGPLFAGSLLTFDVWGGAWRRVQVARRATCATCGVLHREVFTQRSVGS